VRKEEVERSVREVMGSEGTYMMKKAKAAVSKAGSSDGNITEFLSKYHVEK
jgi:hypothetical protein